MGGHTFLSIQHLRAAAAIAVLLHHAMFEMSSRYGGPVIMGNLQIGAAGVDLFFVISGFVMVYASDGLFGRLGAARVFMLRRLVRIVPLYWTATAITLGYYALHYGSRITEIYPPELIAASLLFYPLPFANGQVAPVHGLGWTLNYEMFFYVMFAVALAFPRGLAVGALTTAFILLAVLGAILELPLQFEFWFSPIILEFCFGMLIGWAYLRGVRIAPTTAWVLGGLAIASLAFAALNGVGWRTLQWGGPSALLVAAATLSATTSTSTRAGAFGILLGDASYSLYLLHPLVMATMGQTLAPWFGFSSAPWLAALSMIVGSVVVSIAAYMLFERPVTRWLQGLSHVGFPVVPAKPIADLRIGRQFPMPIQDRGVTSLTSN
jgi:peptidoglycan/LPS O-acetylase OafA/YrhL